MNMNYEPMWRVVDAHRKCADELERTLRELTGDCAAQEYKHDQAMADRPERDDLESYDFVLNTLIEARNQLWAVSNRVGHHVRRQDASRCNVFARRCNEAFNKLARKGEL